MRQHASGTFTTRFEPLPIEDDTLSRMVVEKTIDSGTDELIGLRGEFRIEDVSGTHRYVFTYDRRPG
jgi:transcription-repair coupling factor (superfamily II helicase)